MKIFEWFGIGLGIIVRFLDYIYVRSKIIGYYRDIKRNKTIWSTELRKFIEDITISLASADEVSRKVSISHLTEKIIKKQEEINKDFKERFVWKLGLRTIYIKNKFTSVKNENLLFEQFDNVANKIKKVDKDLKKDCMFHRDTNMKFPDTEKFNSFINELEIIAQMLDKL